MTEENTDISTQDGTESLENQIESILSEDDTNNDDTSATEVESESNTEVQTSENNQDNIEYPEEFLKSDGSVDVENLLKSYQELKPFDIVWYSRI